jgi:hypothetical protein
MTKNTIKIDLVVDDSGTLKVVGNSAEKASKGLNDVANNARTADRNVKGAAQASSNGTKNFSKMAQGMTGGLVPAYAAVAAQVFALTAAFDFLKKAADVQNLKAGQLQFANSTGIALQSVTSKLQEASQGMLSFQEAAQSAAIGAAKGFTTSQLEDLAIGAGKAATALGRDYTDTYDRLIRGVSKAEPELLDELGITLKLAEAKRKYAEMVGVSADQLTAAQSSQAVLVETMSQLNNQFGAIENRPNPFIQLQKTFSGIATQVMSNIMPAFNAIADFLNNNAKAAAIAFAGIVGMVLLNISGLSEGLGKGFDSATNAANSFIDKMDEVEKSIKDAYTKQKEVTTSKASSLVGKGSTSKALSKVASGKSLAPAALGKLKSDIDKAIDKMGDLDEVASGVFKGLTKNELKDFRGELDKTGDSGLSVGQKIKKGLAKTGVRSLKAVRAGARASALAMRGVGKAAIFAAKAFKIFGKATVVLAIIQQLYDMFMKLLEAPATLVNNVISVISNIAKGLQFVLNNVIVRGINGLATMLPTWAKKLLGIEGGGKLMTEFTFADGAEDKLKKLADKGLKKIGVSEGMDALTSMEASAKTRQEDKARVEALKQDFQDLGSEMKNIAEGFEKLSGGAKTKNVANAFATLPILGALKAAKKENLLPELKAAIEASKVSLDAFGPTFKKAFNDNNVEAIEKLTNAGLSYNAASSAITDTLNNLSDLVSEDPIGAKLTLENLKDLALQGDAAAAVLGQTATEVAKVNDAFKDIGGLTTYIDLLSRVIEGQRAVADESQRISLAKITAEGTPSLFREETNRQGAVDSSRNTLLDLETQRLHKITRLIKEGDEAKRIQLANEIAGLQQAKVLEEARLKNAEKNLSDIGRIGTSVGESLSSSMSNAFQGLIEGSMKAKDAFANMANSMLQSISKIITELLVAKLLKSSLGGTSFGTFLGIPAPDKGRYGGVFANGSKLPGYAVGGIASGPQGGYPVELHGTEAVVPLPNGRSIPVEMSGTNSNNSVVVNVSVDNQGGAQTNTEAQSSEQAGKLGKMVAQAVQQELQNQKRSGGILNPYGAA